MQKTKWDSWNPYDRDSNMSGVPNKIIFNIGKNAIHFIHILQKKSNPECEFNEGWMRTCGLGLFDGQVILKNPEKFLENFRDSHDPLTIFHEMQKMATPVSRVGDPCIRF